MLTLIAKFKTKISLLGLAVGVIVVFLSACSASDDSSLNADYPGEIYLSLAHPYDPDKDDYEIVLATSVDAEKMVICEGDAVCSGTGNEASANLVFYNDTSKFFRSTQSALLEKGLKLTFTSFDAAGSVLDSRSVEFSGDQSVPPSTTPNPSTTPGTSNATPVTREAGTRLLTDYCSGAGCHAQYTNPDSVPKADSITRIQSGSMPKGRSMSATDKETLLRFLNGK